MPDIKPADLLSLFGEKTLCVLPDYKRTGLFESDDGTIAKVVYTAKVNPQNWKQKYVALPCRWRHDYRLTIPPSSEGELSEICYSKRLFRKILL